MAGVGHVDVELRDVGSSTHLVVATYHADTPAGAGPGASSSSSDAEGEADGKVFITVGDGDGAGAESSADGGERYGPPPRSLLGIFLAFLSIGARGFGGPVVQISMMKSEFIIGERWMPVERFNRVYAFYQAIPGPEAAELAVFFGYTSNGFVGGILAGIGFILPGFCIMLLLSWLYATYGLSSPYVQASFRAVQPVVTAMIFMALRKLADHSFVDAATKRFSYLLFFQGFLGLLLTVMRVNFLIILAYVGIFNGILTWRSVSPRWMAFGALSWLGLGILTYVLVVVYVGVPSNFSLGSTVSGQPTYAGAFGLACISGMLTFGGAYTVIPYIQQEAVVVGQWITSQQFLDGLALANLIPSPLVMFVTFVGYLALSWGGAFLMTIGIFTPAFAFALLGHQVFSRILDNKFIMPFLDGVTSAVIGIVLVTACNFLRTSVTDAVTGAIFFLAIFVMTQVKGPYTGPLLIAVAACCGQPLFAPR